MSPFLLLRTSLRAGVAAGALLVGGCALTSKATPIETHYFTPESTTAPLAPASQAVDASRPLAETEAPALRGRPRLRIGRVTSSAHLRARIVFRHSPVELGTYDDRRWTENPEVYLRRSLESALFDDHGVVQTMAGGTAVLDIELVAFEEVRRGNARAGRVELVYTLHDETDVMASDRMAVEHEARSGEMSDVVAAIAAALGTATTEVAEVVTKRLGAAPASR